MTESERLASYYELESKTTYRVECANSNCSHMVDWFQFPEVLLRYLKTSGWAFDNESKEWTCQKCNDIGKDNFASAHGLTERESRAFKGA